MHGATPRQQALRTRRLAQASLACTLALTLLGCQAVTSTPTPSSFDILVFSKTAGFRHDSISAGVQTIQALGRDNNFTVTNTEDAEFFSDARLSEFEVVVFLNTTGDVLNEAQKQAFERFIKSGRGFVGVHAASDTEYNWPWYGRLVGAYFNGHPSIQSGTLQVMNADHPSTRQLPQRWSLVEEWYSFRNVQPSVQRLLNLDESSYNLEGTPSMGQDHPLAWHHIVDGGRSWYTGLGHRTETFSDTLFKQHLLGGLIWASGR